MENNVVRSEKSKTRVLVFISFLLGVVCTHLFDKYIYFSPIGSFFRLMGQQHSAVQSMPQNSMDPFEKLQEQMQSMRQQMLENEISGNHFSLNTGQQVTTEEDEKNYYYIINPEGMQVKDFKSDISQGVLTLTAQFVKSDQGMSMSSQMHQSFPLPENAEAEKMDIENKDDKIVIRIPKK